jgi:hypothetical protein
MRGKEPMMRGIVPGVGEPQLGTAGVRRLWIFMLVAAAVGATAPLATQGAARPALATAVEAVHSLTGTVVDYYSREPTASLELSLEWAGAQSSRRA